MGLGTHEGRVAIGTFLEDSGSASWASPVSNVGQPGGSLVGREAFSAQTADSRASFTASRPAAARASNAPKRPRGVHFRVVAVAVSEHMSLPTGSIHDLRRHGRSTNQLLTRTSMTRESEGEAHEQR
jgi:hypothetical protein